MLYRQGDILLKPISQIPKDAKKKNLILAYGEATGHMHQFLDSNLVSVYEVSYMNEHNILINQCVEVIGNAADLVHNEHDTHQIPQGKYEVIQQRELDLSEEIRKVID